MVETVQEMRLFAPNGERLYLTKDERLRFLESSKQESREHRIFCSMLHYTGCRPTEALECKASSIELKEKQVVFRTLKKRKFDNQGRLKQPHYRSVPIPQNIINEIDLVFDLVIIQQQKKSKDNLLWNMNRSTAYRMVKRVMKRANIKGKQATPKGLRHGFGIAMVQGSMPLHLLSLLMGHSDTKVTEIYATCIDDEKREMVMKAWED
jgi:integrase/recombinase XerD